MPGLEIVLHTGTGRGRVAGRGGRVKAALSIDRSSTALEALSHPLLIELTGKIRGLEPHHVDDAKRESQAETQNPCEIPHDISSSTASAIFEVLSAEVFGREVEPV